VRLLRNAIGNPVARCNVFLPRAAERYRRRYEKDPYVRGRYADWVRERVARVREKNGLAAAPPAPVRSARSSGAVQLKLLA